MKILTININIVFLLTQRVNHLYACIEAVEKYIPWIMNSLCYSLNGIGITILLEELTL